MNRSHNYVSIDVIANKIYKNPLLKDINFEDIIDYTLSVIKILRVPGVYKEESCYKEIENHMVALPKIALNIKTVDLCIGNRLIPIRESTYSLSNHTDKINQNYNHHNNTYSINNQILKTSCKQGKIFITFDTIKVDNDNIPMIPDSEALLRAVEAYIKIQVYTVLVDLNKLSERALNRAEQEYYFNVGKAQSEFQGFNNEDSIDSFLNGWKRTFNSEDEHRNRHSGDSIKQNINRL